MEIIYNNVDIKFFGKASQMKHIRKLSERYGLANKKLAEFTELDKIIFYQICNFVRLI